MAAAEELSGPEPDPIVIESLDDTIKLRQLTEADEPRYRGLIAEVPDHLRQFGGDTADKYPKPEACLKTIREPATDRLRFGIWDGDTMVGSINVEDKGGGLAEIGYWVGGKKTGHGYAARALKPMVEYAFTNLGYSELEAHVAVGNQASRKTVEKCGFALTETKPLPDPSGQLRDYWIFNKSKT